jgi:hypothetical protein
MRITAAGNVGIGTSAPGAKLDVNGGSANTEVRFNHADNVVGRTVTLRMSSTQNASYTGAGAYMQAIQGAGVDVYSLAFGTTQGSTSASERMRIDSSGNVGIGTSSPLARLNVSGGATRLQYNVADDNPLIVYNTSSTGYGPYIQAGVGVRYALHVTDYTGTSRMLIQGSGNVGIGTSAPESLLELSADLGPTINLRRSGSTNGNGVIRSIGSSGTVNSAIEFGGGLSNIMGFSTNGSERMRITSTGAVGINTSTPATTLEVYGGLIAGSENRQTHPNASGAGGFKAQWNFSGGSAETDLYNLFSGAVSSFRFYQSTGSGTAQLLYNMQPNSHEFYISGGEQMRLDSSGNLLVGTTTAVEKVTIGSGSATAAGINLRTTQTDFIIQPSNTAAGGVTIGTSWVSGGQGPLIFTTSAGEILRFNNGSIVSPSLADAVGYKGLPQNSQTASYTLALTDMGKMVNTTTGGVIIPANSSVAFPIGSTVVVYNNSASSQTISITTDTIYLAGTATTGSRTLAQRGLATCVKVASTTWVVSGNVT